MSLAHIPWLIDAKKQIKTADGLMADVWELSHTNDAAILSAWAAHFRAHYCPDTMLDALRKGTGLSRSDFLRNIKFPDAATPPGPSTRSGDFAEILAADYIEYLLGYWCPRERWALKWNRNESTKGTDIVGFKLEKKGSISAADEMMVLESKADMTGKPKNRLQEAVNDSEKDKIRQGITLNAIKQRFLERGDKDSADRVERFQDRPDRPFKLISGAVTVCSLAVFDPDQFTTTKTAHHSNSANLKLIIITGAALMDLVHALYERAANEA